MSPYRQPRDECRALIGDDFVEVFVSTPLEVCEQRDPRACTPERGEENSEISSVSMCQISDFWASAPVLMAAQPDIQREAPDDQDDNDGPKPEGIFLEPHGVRPVVGAADPM
jgi:hypothetical protein